MERLLVTQRSTQFQHYQALHTLLYTRDYMDIQIPFFLTTKEFIYYRSIIQKMSSVNRLHFLF